MESEDIEVEDRFSVRPSRVSQAFPGFKVKSFTFFVTVVQVAMYGVSLVIERQEIINPTPTALLTLGANVRAYLEYEKGAGRERGLEAVHFSFLARKFYALAGNCYKDQYIFSIKTVLCNGKVF